MCSDNRLLQLNLWVFLVLGVTFATTSHAGNAGNAGTNQVDTFVPKGWVVEESVQGDITGDGVEDKVLMLLSKAPQEGPDGMEHPRMLLALAGTKSGPYKMLASSRKLLLCQECFGFLGGKPEISVTRKHVLIVDQMAGSRYTDQGIWRFRIDRGTRKLRLIGLDVWHRDRGSGASTLISTNYLTGKQIESQYKYSKAKKKNVMVHTKKRHVPASRTYLEQASSKSMQQE